MDQSKIFDKTIGGGGGGGGMNITRFRSISVSFGSMDYFLFQSWDVRAPEKLSDNQVF